ncbi:MAG TPA: PP2C family protein-serine/threonine phosphatase [Bacteroidota bacterium]|nr:PP2C family protein-serine/threonine phosphatase [Bacteroidota bacterium]
MNIPRGEKAMINRLLIDRLSLHIDSLQEGFELLSRATNLKELGRHFFHFLRGNLTTSEISIWYKPADGHPWELLYGKQVHPEDYLTDVVKTFELKSFGGRHPRVAVVQPLADGSALGVVLGKRLGGAAYSTLDKFALQIFLQLFATAYQSHLHLRKQKELVFSLNHRLVQLNSLIDTGIELTALKKDVSPAALALERAAAATNASRGKFTKKINGKVTESLVFPEGAVFRPPKDKGYHIKSRFTFRGATYEFNLYLKESRSGTVPFEETDQLLLGALARQVRAVVENQFYHEQELAQQRIERELAVAASIQQRILPAALPVIEGYDLFGINIPTKMVGGDYYDAVPLENGSFLLVVADVAGKGIPAALLVSSFQAYLSAYASTICSLTDLAHKLNRSIFEASTAERYITAVVGIFDPATARLETINAGHNPPYLLRRDGSVQQLTAGGIAFGMLDMDFPYETDCVTLEPGERVLFYTDGITEAMDGHGNLYDSAGTLADIMRRNTPASAEQFVRDLVADVVAFTASAPQSDDITALYLFRK